MIKGAYSKSLVNFGQSLEGENYAWLDDPEYPKSDRETFGKGWKVIIQYASKK